MKKIVFSIIISFCSGIIGAFTYAFFFISSTNTMVQNSDFPSGSFASHISEPVDKPTNTFDLAYASQIATSSVVYIKSTTENNYSQENWWFYSNEDGAKPMISSGSGVIYSSDGYIVTNNHVIEHAETIEVVFQKRTYPARVVGTDLSTDLAVLKIEATNLPNIQLGSSQKINIGDWVIAVGNPFNLTSTVTAGIISAKGRDINILRGQFPIESFIQTDAVINPGNSGGALVNREGELVGINTAILSRTGSYNGYGFAIPVDIVKKVVNDIITYGEIQKAFFGGDVMNIDDKIAAQLKLNDYSGVMVSYIEKEGAAEKAGLQKGDIIIELDKEKINSTSEFNEKISYHKPGDEIRITYRRGEKINQATLLLTNREGTTQLIKKQNIYNEFLGADIEIVPKVERDRLAISYGIRIKKTKKGLFSSLGIKEGFIITQINNTKIESIDQLIKLLSSTKGRVIIEGIDDRGVKGYYSFYFQ